ncbi:MAG: hypothetical protein OXT65_10740, partial [Alphaproteobacteria bacterium]|nr:hypothetical protein [Alphaproteobacteria bacterium]
LYAKGDGAPQEAILALKWARTIAKTPPASPFWLKKAGDLLFEGRKGAFPKNYPAALPFYKRAADKGDTHAAARLAEMYAKGMGVNKDPKKATQYQLQAQKKD